MIAIRSLSDSIVIDYTFISAWASEALNNHVDSGVLIEESALQPIDISTATVTKSYMPVVLATVVESWWWILASR